MFATKEGARGIWRLDGTPKRVTNWPDPQNFRDWELSGDRLIFADFTSPDAPILMALPIAGGTMRPIGYPAGLMPACKFAINPKTDLVTYLRMTRQDTDIGWLRLVQR